MIDRGIFNFNWRKVLNQLSIADAAVVGTTFKFDGKFENHVDVNRVKTFMDIVKKFRNEL